jgi:hypothetical protein
MTNRERKYRAALETARAEILAAKNAATHFYHFTLLDNAIEVIDGALGDGEQFVTTDLRLVNNDPQGR